MEVDSARDWLWQLYFSQNSSKAAETQLYSAIRVLKDFFTQYENFRRFLTWTAKHPHPTDLLIST
jgi:hypothetical protein